MLSRLMINLRNPDLAFGHAPGRETLVSALVFVREEADTSDVAVDRKWVDIEGIAWLQDLIKYLFRTQDFLEYANHVISAWK